MGTCEYLKRTSKEGTFVEKRLKTIAMWSEIDKFKNTVDGDEDGQVTQKEWNDAVKKAGFDSSAKTTKIFDTNKTNRKLTGEAIMKATKQLFRLRLEDTEFTDECFWNAKARRRSSIADDRRISLHVADGYADGFGPSSYNGGARKRTGGSHARLQDTPSMWEDTNATHKYKALHTTQLNTQHKTTQHTRH